LANRDTRSDLERLRQLRAAHRSLHTPGRWPPFLLDLDSRMLVEFVNWDEASGRVDVVKWPLKAVLDNLVFEAARSCADAAVTPEERAARGSSKPLYLTTRAELLEWDEQTKQLAARVPYAGVGERMRATVTTMEQLLDWPRRYFVKVPASVDTQAFAEFRVSLALWALEQIRQALDTAPISFWPKMFDWLAKADPPARPPFADYHEAEKRIRRVEENRQPKLGPEPLMADILRDVIALGYFGPDGQPRRSASIH
jgi:hypothetical protein